MSASPDRQIVIELVVRSGHPSFLEGLDAWLQLGLISDSFVRQLCQEELVCLLSEAGTIANVAQAERPAATAASASTPTPIPTPTRPQRPPQPNLISQALQAFMAEISVVWLLFLGVFLVVSSSGVLAATQWRNIAALGQYGILFGYTVVFGVASLWTRQRSTLQLTSRMLAIATLLLIPVNFWMMDGFRLWQKMPELGITAIAAIGLSGLSFLLLRRSTSLGIIAAVLLLGWLHWGWQQPGFPLIATYIGTLAAAAILLYQNAQRPKISPRATLSETLERPTLEVAAAAPPALSSLAIALSALILIGRALFVVQVPVSQLGLAIGVIGWLLVWLARGDRSRLGWTRAGTVLLLLAWLITVGEAAPWQAVAISGLGLWLLVDALWRTGQSSYLAAGFGVGLQLVWLTWLLVPPPWRSQIINWWTGLAGIQSLPFALLALWLFPYLMGTVGFAFYLRRKQRPALAKDAELLALILGGLLIAISLDNPLVRSLTLTLSSLTLIAVTIYRQPRPEALVYLTHGTALTTFFAWMYYGFPNLAVSQWVGVLLVVMALEWGYSATVNQQWTPWTKSAWHFGIILAAISYALLWNQFWTSASSWLLIWLVVPAILTALGYRDRFPAAHSATALSVLSLVLAQPLMLETSNTRLASFGLATLLMLFNTRQLQQGITAVLTVGFGLGFWSFILQEVFAERLTFGWFMLLVTGTILLLWGLHHRLLQHRSHLSNLYRQAIDGWAIVILLLTFLLLSISQLLTYRTVQPAAWEFVAASGVLVIATTYRTWQRPNHWTWFAIAYSVELLVVSGLLLQGRSLTALAIANIALGFLALGVGNWWIGRFSPPTPLPQSSTPNPHSLTPTPQPPTPSSPIPSALHLIPLAYALLGVGLGHHTFTAITGFFTLGGALVALGVGRRLPLLKPIAYLGLAGVTIAGYEWLIYQLLQAKGGRPGDGLVMLAALAVVFAIAYRGLQRVIAAGLRLTIADIQLLAHLHWLLGTTLLVIAPTLTLGLIGHWWWTAIVLLLALYALTLTDQNLTFPPSPTPHSPSPNPQPPYPTPQFWAYTGILQLLAAIASLLWLLLPRPLLIDWAGAIAAVLAVIFYLAPWQRWGWERLPWRQTAALLPGGVILLTGWGANLQSLLVVAAFYAWLASVERQIRLSYISVLLANWALMRLLTIYSVTQPLWYAIIWGGSLLYLAQVEPELQTQQRYEQRHWVRSLAAGLICLTGFYQAETGITGLSPFAAGFVAIAVEFGFIVLGLVQRVRAFLYVGTIAFILQVLWQLWRFVQDYSLLLWIFGIVLGLLLIWVAATFEARRVQANALLQHWITELEDWQ
ncbi:MAG: hypothetical protein NW224_00685 [Leptolyngbyaceae cyanobacterium bins.302]|nr:hypothetical protein [Leptolyngbyaceae cyanobacterium bins.302]